MVVNKAADKGRAGTTSGDGKDVLRAKDIVPPYGDQDDASPNVREAKAAKRKASSSRKSRKQPSAETAQQLAGQGPTPDGSGQSESPKTGRRKTEVPRFDLSRDIMAEHRKVTATRRRAPGSRVPVSRKTARAGSTDYAIEKPAPVTSEQSRIIAEIVARDIERLCAGNSGRGIRGI
jgi:hypothetical protein